MKSLIDFESAQPFAVKFLTHALESNHLVNAYILRGKDLRTPYKLVLRLAQIINCMQPTSATQACGQCQPCRWIEENAHPGVITVSNLTYLVDLDPETGASKTKTGRAQQSIVVGQMENLLQELSLHSGGFHRVVILTGAQEVSAVESLESPFPAPKDWHASEGLTFEPVPLDRKVFPDRLANKFLKTLEEPPSNVIFFLLTDAEDKLLDTIISRCQLVPFQTPMSYYQVTLPEENRACFVQVLKTLSDGDFMTPMQTFLTFTAENNIATAEGLTQLQAFLWQQVQQNPSLEKQRFVWTKETLRHLEHAKVKLQDRVREDAVLEDLFLTLAGH